MDCSTWASLSITNSQNLLKLMSIESVMPFNHLILCCPFLFLNSIFPSIRIFSNESYLYIRWPKYWSFTAERLPCWKQGDCLFTTEHGVIWAFSMTQFFKCWQPATTIRLKVFLWTIWTFHKKGTPESNIGIPLKNSPGTSPYHGAHIDKPASCNKLFSIPSLNMRRQPRLTKHLRMPPTWKHEK